MAHEDKNYQQKDLKEDQGVLEIKEKLELIHKDIKRMIENFNQEYLNLMLENLKKDFLNCITSYTSADIEKSLERGMVDKCPMRGTCKSKFTDLLEENTNLLRCGNAPEESIKKNKAVLNGLKQEAPFQKCEVCFSEVYDLFDRQLKLMRSLQVYRSSENKEEDIKEISDEEMVRGVLEPLSNRQRLQILRSIASQTRTFSSLSEITGLRGGNLLFHIQKLLDGGMIIQRHERGDYMITQKGYKLLNLLVEAKKILNE